MLASPWMKQRQSFLKVRNYSNVLFGSVILSIYSVKRLTRKKNLTQFLNELNNFNSNLKITYETASCPVNFLDLNVSSRNGAIHTNLYTKPTDGHQYLHYQFSHPQKDQQDFFTRKGFLNSGFPCEGMAFGQRLSEIVINNQIDQVVFGRHQSIKKTLKSSIPFVTIYHPEIKELEKLIIDLLPFS